MSSTTQHRRRSILGLGPRGCVYIAIAFALGLLLFALIWLRQRNGHDFFRVDSATQTTTGRRFEPLPVPDLEPADESGRPQPPARIEPAPPPVAQAPAPVAPEPEPSPSENVPTPEFPASSRAATNSAPVPLSTTQPTYPREALRRGESGEVLVRVSVGPDGVPTAADVVRSSGSRALDRAASAAVRQWRFVPARRDGQAVAGEVRVPIAFDLRR